MAAGAARRISAARRLQRRPAGRLRPLADEHPQRTPLQRCRRPICARRWRARTHGRGQGAGRRGSSSTAIARVGIEYLQDGQTAMARAEREVILCRRRHQLAAAADAVGDRRSRTNSPRMALPCKSRSPGVGKNLQDHLSVELTTRGAEPGPFHARMRIDRIALALAQRLFFGQGIATDLPGGCMAFLKTRARRETARRADSVQRRADGRVRPIWRRSSAVEDGYSPGVPCCCGRRAAARSSLPPPIRRRAAHPAEFLASEGDRKPIARGRAPGPRGRPAAADGAVHRLGDRTRPGENSDAEIDAHVRKARPHRPSSARHVQDGRRDAIRWRWSIRECACAASRVCASSMRR